MPDHPQALDLFCGAGGPTLGLAAAGWDVLGVEWDHLAARAHALAGHPTICADIRDLDPAPWRGHFDLLWASPPCQTFSAAGKGHGRRDLDLICDHARNGQQVHGMLSDHRSELVLEPLRWVQGLRRPNVRAVIFEQVRAVLPVWEACAEYLELLGYDCWTGVLHAEQYGVPQTRQRAFLIARCDGADAEPPTPTHQRYRKGKPDDGSGLPRPVSMATALGWSVTDRVGFPRRDDTGTSPGGYRERDWRDAGEPAFGITEKARSWLRSNNSVAGEGRAERSTDDPAFAVTSRADLWTHGVVSTGNNSTVSRDGSTALYERDLNEPAPTLTGNAKVWTVGEPGHRKPALRGSTTSNATVHEADEPAPTLLGNIGKQGGWAWVESDGPPPTIRHEAPSTTIAGDPRVTSRVHHDPGMQGSNPKTTEQVRNGEYEGHEPVKLTIDEAKVLQTFPVDHPFQGSRTAQFLQNGNAVPPLLAEAVGRSVQ